MVELLYTSHYCFIIFKKRYTTLIYHSIFGSGFSFEVVEMYNNGMSKIHWSSPSPVYLFNNQFGLALLLPFISILKPFFNRLMFISVCAMLMCKILIFDLNDLINRFYSMTVYLHAIVRIFTFLFYSIFEK